MCKGQGEGSEKPQGGLGMKEHSLTHVNMHLVYLFLFGKLPILFVFFYPDFCCRTPASVFFRSPNIYTVFHV